MHRWALAAAAVLGLVLTACGGRDIVVGKEWRFAGNASQVCVRYRASSGVEETCVLWIASLTAIAANDCYFAAKVGEPLPDECR